MNEPLTIRTERVDDIPLLLAQMQRMGIARLLDEHFPTHGNREGLSLGEVTIIWLTHVHSQADHHMNRVQPWAERRLETLRVLTLLEFVVRRRLAQEGAALAGLYAGNPKRAPIHPTTEHLLEAFQEITLTLVLEPHQTRRHVTALSSLHLRL